MADKTPTASAQITFGQELARKATHVGALVIPGGYYFLGLNRSDMLIIMVPITAIMILIDIARIRQWRFWRSFAGKIISPLVRQHEKAGDFMGATYILLAVCLTVTLYDKPIAVAALAFIIVGDTLAALIGRRFGRHRFGNKSIEGSLACLGGCAIVAVIVPNLTWEVRFSGAIVATIVEALPLGTDDNITVPVLSGLWMTLLSRILTNF